MFAKVSIVAVCSLLAVVSAEPHVLTPVGPAVVTAQSSQVFARNYNAFVPFPIAAPAVPAAVPAPAYPFPAAPAFFVPAPQPTPVFYPQHVLYNPPAPLPAIPAVPAVPAVAVAPAAPAAKLVAVAPVAKVAKLVRPASYLTTIRYRSVVA
uniref:Uncharacterized protein n=1 Tax=Anopheles atroparvus TaxID=41427 RepID=A0A182IN52_ANOAO